MFAFEPIGVIHSPFTDPGHTPIQPFRSQAEGLVEVWPQYLRGLQGLEGFSHLLLLYLFHLSAPGYELSVTPFLDDQATGLFATRYPRRPNNLGLSVVQLLALEGCCLRVGGIDILDGTPLLDLKPHIPRFDCPSGTRIGWLEGRV
jgi:tRNA-Thr(GGU) m(6)t(6)A37 methyltransferase TsaA